MIKYDKIAMFMNGVIFMKKKLVLLLVVLVCAVCCSCISRNENNVVSESKSELELTEENDVEIFKLNKKLGNDEYLLNREVKSIDSIESYTI